jgi:hypothetical protein
MCYRNAEREVCEWICICICKMCVLCSVHLECEHKLVALLLVAAEQTESAVLFSQKMLLKAFKIALVTPTAERSALDGHDGEVDVGCEAQETQGTELGEGSRSEEGWLVVESPGAERKCEEHERVLVGEAKSDGEGAHHGDGVAATFPKQHSTGHKYLLNP